ncbi:MAG: hypothetical protein Ta2D_06030 [Rickettsiales bacterium]|nr:MAG: hypothetical protein Ta2D_06030 [Rickettsiales bacterium]
MTENIEYRSVDIARHLIEVCKERGINDLLVTKTNKLLYAVYGTYLAMYDVPVLNEKPKFFPHGPVFPNVMRKFDDEIKDNGLKIDFGKNEKIIKVIERVVNIFGKFNATTLSNWSHEKNTPWDKMKSRGEKYSEPFRDVEIKEYFIDFLELKNDK